MYFKRHVLTDVTFLLQPKLTMARCRRNVDNFLEACRKIGVDEVRNLVSFGPVN